jgi:eukaryotic-like serine/threonine-protein kinase
MQFKLFAGRYQLQDPIGRDDISTTYHALNLSTGLVISIRVLREFYSNDANFMAQFQRDARAPSLMQHSNIVQVYDYGQTDSKYFFVMELIESTDLFRCL